MPKGIPKDKSDKRQILHQLKIAKGHLEKVIQMTENREYCIDIIHQNMAIQAALKKIDQRILKNHMQTCVTHSIKRGQEKEVIDEIMTIMEKI